ncbi:hypothetical protein N7510_006996 [Penicillium lagena]|uniref:uncharacterized protein n=1 Tax=Penicillium lagena TaxID=94218 RepID=UPI00253F79F0|nr:uncharacterized protein N7510_006996 [Penicillium lagena]KAJ5610277.1 hypothetical protein N7510_006996 [Penicillium lagena]
METVKCTSSKKLRELELSFPCDDSTSSRRVPYVGQVWFRSLGIFNAFNFRSDNRGQHGGMTLGLRRAMKAREIFEIPFSVGKRSNPKQKL